MKKILSILLLSFSVTTVFAQYQLSLRENFDFDWKFSLSDDLEYANLEYALLRQLGNNVCTYHIRRNCYAK